MNATRAATVFVLSLVLRISLFGHEQIVHRAITVNAAASALTGASAFSRFMTTVTSDCSLSDATNALAEGSEREDDTHKDLGGVRVFNHFYDPLNQFGLSDFPLAPKDAPYGQNSFVWASTLDGPGIDEPGSQFPPCLRGNVNRENNWSWQNARIYAWDGLTAQTKNARFEALLNMFRAVGQVVHLLEDASQPQHVRNEQHVPEVCEIPMPWRSPIESYGKEKIDSLNYQHGMLDWKAAGFTKLEDFWDRHLYNGTDASALVADANGGPKLGLAEFINGNFVGTRHSYRELMVSKKYKLGGQIETKEYGYYPYPTRDSGTTYNEVKVNPNVSASTLTMRNGELRTGPFLKKVGEGIVVNKHSRINYLAMKGVGGTVKRAVCTINDEEVLKEYHSIVIPKAVEYSAGLLDYFFRGKLEITVAANVNGGYDLQIKNVSGQDLKGGEFRLYWDDSSDTRTRLPSTETGNSGKFEMTSWSSGSQLADNSSTTATFKPPTGVTVTKYTLLYRGIIGSGSSGGPIDPVERDSAGQDLAIAAQTIRFPQAWWKLDATSPGAEIDVITGVALQINTSDLPSYSSVAGKKSGAWQLASGARFGEGGDPNFSGGPGGEYLAYNGGGFSIVMWLKVPVLAENGVGGGLVYYVKNSSPNSYFTILWDEDGSVNVSAFLGFSSSASVSTAAAEITSGTFNFIFVSYDPSDGKVRISVNDGPVYTHSGIFTVPAYNDSISSLSIYHGFSQPNSTIFDEVGLFPFPLTPEQVSYLYNFHDGVVEGRTWPFTLP